MKPGKQITPIQIINISGVISLVFGLVCGFDPEIMSSIFIMLVVNIIMGAIIFGHDQSGGDQ